MKLYWTTIGELLKSSPQIFTHNLKGEGMFISAPGTMIWRTKEEAIQGIEEAKKVIEEKGANYQC